MKELKKIMIVNSKATMDAVYAALVFANGAQLEELQSEIFCTFFGMEMIQTKKMDHLHLATVGNPGIHLPTLVGGLPGVETYASSKMKKELDKHDIPSVSEFLSIYQGSGGKVFACSLSMELLNIKKEHLWKGVDGMLTIGDFYERSMTEKSQIIFI